MKHTKKMEKSLARLRALDKVPPYMNTLGDYLEMRDAQLYPIARQRLNMARFADMLPSSDTGPLANGGRGDRVPF